MSIFTIFATNVHDSYFFIVIKTIDWLDSRQQFQKEPSITFHSENYKQKGVSFFVISTTNSCLFLQKRADTFFPELFRSRRLKSAFDSFDLSSWQPQCETFDVITRWQRRSNLHPLISRIMTSTLYSTSFNVRYFC